MLRLAVTGALLAAGLPYLAGIEKWRADHEAELKAEGGWLSVSGLIWLHQGANAAPGGTAWLRNRQVTFEDAKGHKTGMKANQPAVAPVTLIQRGDRFGLRLRDPNATTRRNFTGCKWFPAKRSWHIKARWVAYPQPKQIPIVNVLGMTSPEPSPGYAEFTVNGKALRLEPITEDDHLFFLFKDQTSGRSTYGAGRFLYAAMPTDGLVDLDFNKAENPPCAFTAYATCALPPRQNALPVAIEAGERRYGDH